MVVAVVPVEAGGAEVAVVEATGAGSLVGVTEALVASNCGVAAVLVTDSACAFGSGSFLQPTISKAIRPMP